MAALSAWGASVACQRRRKAILPAFGAATATFLGRIWDCHPTGGRAGLGRHGEGRAILISILYAESPRLPPLYFYYIAAKALRVRSVSASLVALPSKK